MVHKVIGSGLEKGAQWDCHHERVDKRLMCESRSKMGKNSVSIQVEVKKWWELKASKYRNLFFIFSNKNCGWFFWSLYLFTLSK